MPLTRPIPPEAMPVVERIRREVPRPERLPWPDDDNDGLLRFYGQPRWPLAGCTPSGLLPEATSPAPCEIGPLDFWWDEQTDPVAATDALWPTEGA